MKKLIYFIVFFIYLITCSYSWAEFCPSISYKVTINNKVTYDRLKYDFSKPLSELKSLSQKAGKGHVLGLFVHTLHFKGYGSRKTSSECVESIEYVMEVDFDPTIYVASNYQKGSKEYDYILWHETEHAKILIENNKKYLGILEQKMKKYASGIKMTKASNPKEAQNNGNIIFEKLHNAFMINMNDLNKMINGLQEDFDKKEDKQGKGKWYLSST